MFFDSSTASFQIDFASSMQPTPDLEEVYTGSLPAFGVPPPKRIGSKSGKTIRFWRELTGFNGIATLRPTCPKRIDCVNVLSFSRK
jgi:hypothetical protein|tara:strand:+ start:3721 stop:3978 length:258 start_codon:yes stop_codon:yes gene_type:complete